jgi:hypothetical protein
MSAPVETKVVAATGGGGAGAIIGEFVLYLLSITAYDSMAAIPQPVQILVVTGCSAVAAYLSGWLAPHSSRLKAVTPPV